MPRKKPTMRRDTDFHARPAYLLAELPTTFGITSRSGWYRFARDGQLRVRQMGPRKKVVLHDDLMAFLKNLPPACETSEAAKGGAR
ncbi:MAG: hypothetical protein LAO06_18160 [Acidobacteriia bacterium]|nr:hypothetical protein [Terriglobia bacterium]